jgi:tryptophan-rich sensory protein
MRLQVGDIVSLVVAVVIPLVVGGLGGIATASAIPTWYQGLDKPAWNPPNWVFGPVWTLLYVLMGVAAWLVWRQGWDNPQVRGALAIFGVQLLLNLFWSLIFFGLRSPGWAVLEIVVLWGFILATTVQFYRLESVAGLLLVPYQLWVTFAAVLNATIWQLNR